MKILLFGATGQVGFALQRALAGLAGPDELVCSSRGDGRWPADFDRPAEVAQLLRTLRPDVVVNAAAWTAVDAAEDHAEAAFRVNATSPGAIAIEARKLGALLLHYSSDHVFDGSGSQPWRESDSPGPLSVYGQTKLQGEVAVAGCANHLILRTSWVYAARGANFAKTMLRLAQQRDALSVINDQVGAPTSAELLADVTAHAIRALLANPQLAGLYHCAAAGQTNWHAYACYVLEQALDLGWLLKAGPAQVAAITTSDYPTPARRPLNSRLDTSRLQRAFGLRLPQWQLQVRRMLEEITPANGP